ncbi:MULTISPECIES: hypothetical protein [unclassified Bradyrhizobium]|uniref:hypothetical protein n=1 Tax=unclassified Bradyrhizobium TaxID=2631580 RepID=UPI001FFBF11D|nr:MULTISPECIES: hypothetical protein [unclassified Bradyrhizobium]MCK1297420.1 hypothetical protein [Bradyrhizobium sp. 37]MCK1774187.1 hypothetical protein [Bradyrhizobium sp. 134]
MLGFLQVGRWIIRERVLARHVAALKTINGLTWSGIASLLVRAGARRSDGKLISADQIRVGYARASRSVNTAPKPIDTAEPASKLVARQKPVASANSRSGAARSEPITGFDTAVSGGEPGEVISKEDVSNGELAAALDRLNKIK